MKKTRLLGYFLAAAACALSIPACGGGDGAGDTYISARQFANGGKAFKIDGQPSIRLKGGGDRYEGWDRGAAEEAVQGSEYGPAGSVNVPPPAVSGEYEGVANIKGSIETQHGPISADINYATFGGPTGVGVMQVRPQDAPSNISDYVAQDIVHFLGAVTPGDVQINNSFSSGYGVLNQDSYPRLVMFTISGLAYRVVIDFSKRSLEFYVEYPSNWEGVVLDSSGNVIPGVVAPMSELIEALRLPRPYFVEPG